MALAHPPILVVLDPRQNAPHLRDRAALFGGNHSPVERLQRSHQPGGAETGDMPCFLLLSHLIKQRAKRTVMRNRFDFIVVGAGILGVVLAAFAARMGYRPLVLRLSDRGRPRADTLRNQGLLLSGVMNRLDDFSSAEAFRAFGVQVYNFGREMLRECGLPPPSESGLLFASNPARIAELHEVARLLGLPDHEFRRLDGDDARRAKGEHWKDAVACFRTPDCPFDEASVLEHYRRAAKADGAWFIELERPARLARIDGGVRIRFDGLEIDAPLVVVAAGAGSFELMAQYGSALSGSLQRTPLLVAEAPAFMPAAVVADLDCGMVGVRHARGGDPAALVLGTYVKCKNVPFSEASQRIIPKAKQEEFRLALPSGFRDLQGRFTAGYELVPSPELPMSRFQPWIDVRGDVIFASPGRATIATLAATKTLAEIIKHRRADHSRKAEVDISACKEWDDPIAMHFMNGFHFNDGEEGS